MCSGDQGVANKAVGDALGRSFGMQGIVRNFEGLCNAIEVSTVLITGNHWTNVGFSRLGGHARLFRNCRLHVGVRRLMGVELVI